LNKVIFNFGFYNFSTFLDISNFLIFFARAGARARTHTHVRTYTYTHTHTHTHTHTYIYIYIYIYTGVWQLWGQFSWAATAD